MASGASNRVNQRIPNRTVSQEQTFPVSPAAGASRDVSGEQYAELMAQRGD